MITADRPLTNIPANGLAVRVEDVHKNFGSVSVLRGVTFSLGKGEILGVIGPSGGGKSTLLRCINLLESIDHGRIDYFNRYTYIPSSGLEESVGTNVGDTTLREADIVTIRREVGLVFQGFNLWEEKTVLANLTLAPRVVLKQRRQAVEQRARELCKQFGLEDKVNLSACRLSGGQRQRVAIMRALMMEPKVLLLDEVTSALDPLLTYEVMQTIQKLQEQGLTMIIVTHHLEFATSLCDRIIFLAHGQVVQIDTPENLRNMPGNEEIEKFLEILVTAR